MPLALEENKLIFCLVFPMFHLGDVNHTFHFLRLHHTTAGTGIQKIPYVRSGEDHVNTGTSVSKIRNLLPHIEI